MRKSWSGVDLFFVISGYVVTTSLVRLLPDLRDAATFSEAFDQARGALRVFYTRRFFRIIPAALTVALAHRVLCDVFPMQFGSANQWLAEAIAFFGGVYNYALPVTLQNELGVYWSLSIEEHYYLLLPLLFVAVRTVSRRVGACVAIIAVIVLVIRPMGHPEAHVDDMDLFERFSSQFRFDSLMAGTALALLWPTHPKEPLLPPRFVRFALVPLAILLLVALPGAVPAYVMNRVGLIALWLLGSVLVGYAALDRGYVLAFPVVGRLLEYLGARSYALYLIHFDMGRLEEALMPRLGSYASFVSNGDWGAWCHFFARLAAALLVSELLYRGVEKPLIAAGRAVLDTRDGRPGTVPRWTGRAATALGIVVLVFPFRHLLVRALAPKNLAYRKSVAMSSQEPGTPGAGVLVDGSLDEVRGAHTRKEDHPWLEIDLGEVQTLGTFVVYNRADGWQDAAIPLTISVSADHSHYSTVDVRERIFSQGLPWLHSVPGGLRARYVKLSVARETSLCLSEVEVYAGW